MVASRPLRASKNTLSYPIPYESGRPNGLDLLMFRTSLAARAAVGLGTLGWGSLKFSRMRHARPPLFSTLSGLAVVRGRGEAGKRGFCSSIGRDVARRGAGGRASCEAVKQPKKI
jgi:hypothetical protein